MKKSGRAHLEELDWLHRYSGKWYELSDRWAASGPLSSAETHTIEVYSTKEINHIVTNLIDTAKNSYEKLTQKFQTIQAQDTQYKFIQKAIQSGTFKDKISALVLTSHQNIFFATEHIRQLSAACLVKRKDDAKLAQDALKDILINHILIPDQNLKFFHKQPTISFENIREQLRLHAIKHSKSRIRAALSQPETVSDISRPISLPDGAPPLKIDITEETLAMHYFEDQMKQIYAHFIQLLTASTQDTMKFTKMHAIDLTAELLAASTEQSLPLITILINKLGDNTQGNSFDPSANTKKSTSMHAHVSSKLAEAMSSRPRELKALAFELMHEMLQNRPNVQPVARYRVLLFLSEMQLSTQDGNLPANLIKLYISQFQLSLKYQDDATKRKPMSRKLKQKLKRKGIKPKIDASAGQTEAWQSVLRASLTGLRRALPYAAETASSVELFESKVERIGGTDEDEVKTETLLDVLYRASHIAPSAALRVEILGVLWSLNELYNTSSDRYYRALYDQAKNQDTLSSRARNTLVKLVVSAVKADFNSTRAVALIKRLLQTTTAQCFEHPSIQILAIVAAAHCFIKHDTSRNVVLFNEKKEEEEVSRDGDYDGLKREPMYSGADAVPLYELLFLVNSVNPVVSVYAKKVIEGARKASKIDNVMERKLGLQMLEEVVTQGDKLHLVEESEQGAMLDALEYIGKTSWYTGDDKNNSKRVQLNTLDFWNKYNAHADGESFGLHLNSLKQYFEDPIVRRRLEMQKRSNKKRDSNALGDDDDDSGSEMGEIVDDEDELDKIFNEGHGVDDALNDLALQGHDDDDDDDDEEEEDALIAALRAEGYGDEDGETDPESMDEEDVDGGSTDPESMDEDDGEVAMMEGAQAFSDDGDSSDSGVSDMGVFDEIGMDEDDEMVDDEMDDDFESGGAHGALLKKLKSAGGSLVSAEDYAALLEADNVRADGYESDEDLAAYFADEGKSKKQGKSKNRVTLGRRRR